MTLNEKLTIWSISDTDLIIVRKGVNEYKVVNLDRSITVDYAQFMEILSTARKNGHEIGVVKV